MSMRRCASSARAAVQNAESARSRQEAKGTRASKMAADTEGQGIMAAAHEQGHRAATRGTGSWPQAAHSVLSTYKQLQLGRPTTDVRR
eukprot:1148733-Pelagomonas_calceolata.AAC.8